MSDALVDKVRERIGLHVALAKAEEYAIGWRNDLMDALRADMETALVLARREGMLEGMLEGMHHSGLLVSGKGPAIRERYPLPTRTRRVLREEPVPGTGWPLYRIREGLLEWTIGQSAGSSFDWRTLGSMGGGDFDTMAHALDLHDNPYRTDQVPGDESDPWGERAP